jgi:hypothetical protein
MGHSIASFCLLRLRVLRRLLVLVVLLLHLLLLVPVMQQSIQWVCQMAAVRRHVLLCCAELVDPSLYQTEVVKDKESCGNPWHKARQHQHQQQRQ